MTSTRNGRRGAAGRPAPRQRKSRSRGRAISLPGITTLDQYLERYAGLLGQQAINALNPLHVPGRDQPHRLNLKRPLFDPQAHVVTAAAKTLDRQSSVLIVAECGTGKTIMGMATAHACARGKPYAGLVMCPGQLVPKWAREITETLPDVEVRVIRTFRDLLALRKQGRPLRPTWWIVARDRAKLGAKWRACNSTRRRDGMPVCPRCGAPVIDPAKETPIPQAKLARKQHFCRAEKACVDGSVPKDHHGQARTCGEPLWTFTRRFNRWEPARFIQKHLRGFFQYLVCDEIHQEKGACTAQANALGSLAVACGKTIALTGTLIGGYADHIRPLLFRLAPASLVREGLDWSEHVAFNERYGRIETRIFQKEGDGDDNDQSRGSKSKTAKYVRPGIMPTLFGRHLLDKCIFLSLDEVAEHLPPLVEKVLAVPLDAQQQAAYDKVERDLAGAIKVLVRLGSRRLLGAMLATLLGYPDHPYGFGRIGYRDAAATFHHVTTCPDLDADIIRPKEQALLDLVAKEKAEGRQCWVYVQLTKKRDVLARLEKLLAAAGHRVKVMRSHVAPEKREAWIAQHGRDADVVLSHPQLVETGMDLFCKSGGHNFCTLIFYETGYNLFTMRQASRRGWRIGQTQECRVYYLCYAGTMQDRALSLMGQKLVAAQALDGKFTSEGLAAMAGEDASVEMQLAESLAQRMREEDAQRVWAKVGSGLKPPLPVAPAVPSRAVDVDPQVPAALRFEPPRHTAVDAAVSTNRAKPRLLWDDDATQGRAARRQPARRHAPTLFD